MFCEKYKKRIQYLISNNKQTGVEEKDDEEEKP